VQHHHAHIAACLAEYGVSGKVIGLAMDGTGFGTDGTAWGGELMIADTAVFSRAGHFRTFSLPGSEKAIREPWRIAAGLLKDAFGPQWQAIAAELELVPPEIPLGDFAKVLDHNINSPRTSSLGRLFDAVSALLGVRRKVSFEGQAAMELEGLAGNGPDVDVALGIERGESLIIDPLAAVRKLVELVLGGVDKRAAAAAFHGAVVSALVEAAALLRDKTGLDRVALGGGCFQNRILLEGCEAGLEALGFEVFSPSMVPCNDGCISLGQAVIAAEQIREG
jgi:hydrogenase maturation protein HypF